jgi:2-keto-4-pentenoate hydratase
MKQRKTLFLLIILLVIINALIVIGAAQSKETLDVEAMIEQMLDGRQRQIQIPPLTQKYGSFSMVKAYHIQDLMAREVTGLLGPVCGYKVAYASRAAQKQFGMDEPARGPFFMTQRLPSGSTLPVEAFNEIMLETEVAFTLGKPISKPVKDVAALKSYVKWVHPAFDAGNFPYTTDQAKPTPQDMIAIGTGAHVFILGPALEPGTVDIDSINLSLVRNGEKIRESPARDVMGSPWNSLLWCANNLTKSGHVLEPGMVVLCGTAAPAYKVKGSEIKGVFEGDCGALGKVALTIN